MSVFIPKIKKCIDMVNSSYPVKMLAVCQFTVGQSLKIILSEMRSLKPGNILREAVAKKRHEGDQES